MRKCYINDDCFVWNRFPMIHLKKSRWLSIYVLVALENNLTIRVKICIRTENICVYRMFVSFISQPTLLHMCKVKWYLKNFNVFYGSGNFSVIILRCICIFRILRYNIILSAFQNVMSLILEFQELFIWLWKKNIISINQVNKYKIYF